MPDPIIFLHDPDQAILEKHSLPLLRDTHGLAEAGFDLRYFHNRNDLLATIATEEAPSLALIDLQHDERRDLNYSGHRIIETIRYHPRLSSRCRPYGFSVHAHPKVLRLVEDHGAYGIVARNALDATTTADLDFAAQLRAELRRPAYGIGRDVECHVLPEGTELLEPDDDQARTIEEIGKVFDRQSDLNEKQWMALRYAADNLGPAAIGPLIQDQYGTNGTRLVEKLQEKLRIGYRTTGPDLRAAALDLFQALPHKRPVPDHQINWNVLARMRDAERLEDSRLMGVGFVDDEARATYYDVARVIDFRGLGNSAQQHQHVEVVKSALDQLTAGVPADQRQQVHERRERALVRAVNNIVDTATAEH